MALGVHVEALLAVHAIRLLDADVVFRRSEAAPSCRCGRQESASCDCASCRHRCHLLVVDRKQRLDVHPMRPSSEGALPHPRTRSDERGSRQGWSSAWPRIAPALVRARGHRRLGGPRGRRALAGPACRWWWSTRGRSATSPAPPAAWPRPTGSMPRRSPVSPKRSDPRRGPARRGCAACASWSPAGASWSRCSSAERHRRQPRDPRWSSEPISRGCRKDARSTATSTSHPRARPGAPPRTLASVPGIGTSACTLIAELPELGPLDRRTRSPSPGRRVLVRAPLYMAPVWSRSATTRPARFLSPPVGAAQKPARLPWRYAPAAHDLNAMHPRWPALGRPCGSM